ncbi:MAG: hypothetical protein FWE30_00525 [Bacteroidales bacterium]|nr:hypothetical protein [Bacteroidales bacterium]
MSITRKIVCVFIWAACFAGLQAHAQSPAEDKSGKKYTVAIQPLQLLKNSLRIDVEMRINDGPGWLQFGPAVYYYPKTNEPDYYYIGKHYHYTWYHRIHLSEPCSGMFGGGLDVNYKWFLDPKRSVYLLGGLSFAHFNIRYWGWAWSDYYQNELLYHEYLPDYRRQHINRTGINWLFGFQPPSRHAFLFDMFVGFSYRHSFSDKNKPSFDTNMFSYGFTGPVFVTGVRFGIGIKD